MELSKLNVEQRKRERAKSDLLTYASSIDIPGAPLQDDNLSDEDDLTPITTRFGRHHLLWLDILQQVEDGKIKRAMGLMPPGSAKSTYTSIVFPTHVMGRYPGSSVILTSYGDVLPRKFGRRARSIIKQPVYQRIFDCTLSEESSAVDEWALTNGSEWMAAGILTGITGNRADGVIWDDLIKGREQADSDVTRNKTWDAYVDDLLTRKKPGAWEIAVTTRWHEDDPAGRILPLNYNGESGWIKGRDGNLWYVVCIPAQCERKDDVLKRKVGDYLWPEWFPPGFFDSFKRNARSWSSLYQQRPAPESGEFFLADWLLPYEKAPARETLRIYGASDYAVTKNDGDYTVHIVVGVDSASRIWVLDLWRKQTTSDEWVEVFCDMVKQWRPLGWAEESGQIRSAVGPLIHKRLMERQLYVARAEFPSRKDKRIRAQPIRGRMAMNGLYVPVGADWYPDFKNELMVFDNGRNDDQVDALSLIGQILDRMQPGEGEIPEKEKPKVFSTDPQSCTVTLQDMWEANDRRNSRKSLRIV
jgi:predicted phage terminase large subunit-like protein